MEDKINLNKKIYEPTGIIDIEEYIEEKKKEKDIDKKSRIITNSIIGVSLLIISAGLYFLYEKTIKDIKGVNNIVEERIDDIKKESKNRIVENEQKLESKTRETKEIIENVERRNKEEIDKLEKMIENSKNDTMKEDIGAIKREIIKIREENINRDKRISRLENNSKTIKEDIKDIEENNINKKEEVREENIKVCGLDISREECEYKAKLDEKEYYQIGKEIRQVDKKGIIKYVK